MALVPFLQEALEFPIYSIIAIGGSIFIGLLQGLVLGKAVTARFARVRRHARIFSVGLLALFLFNTLISLPRFASTDRVRLSELLAATDSHTLVQTLFTLMGVGTGILAIFAISVTVASLVLLHMAPIKGASKALVIIVSALVMFLTAVSRFTDLSPSSLEVLLFFVYQLGITIGIFFGTLKNQDKRDRG